MKKVIMTIVLFLFASVSFAGLTEEARQQLEEMRLDVIKEEVLLEAKQEELNKMKEILDNASSTLNYTLGISIPIIIIGGVAIVGGIRKVMIDLKDTSQFLYWIPNGNAIIVAILGTAVSSGSGYVLKMSYDQYKLAQARVEDLQDELDEIRLKLDEKRERIEKLLEQE